MRMKLSEKAADGNVIHVFPAYFRAQIFREALQLVGVRAQRVRRSMTLAAQRIQKLADGLRDFRVNRRFCLRTLLPELHRLARFHERVSAVIDFAIVVDSILKITCYPICDSSLPR